MTVNKITILRANFKSMIACVVLK